MERQVLRDSHADRLFPSVHRDTNIQRILLKSVTKGEIISVVRVWTSAANHIVFYETTIATFAKTISYTFC